MREITVPPHDESQREEDYNKAYAMAEESHGFRNAAAMNRRIAQDFQDLDMPEDAAVYLQKADGFDEQAQAMEETVGRDYDVERMQTLRHPELYREQHGLELQMATLAGRLKALEAKVGNASTTSPSGQKIAELRRELGQLRARHTEVSAIIEKLNQV